MNIDKLKRQVEENPLGAMAVGAFAMTAITKLMNAVTDRKRAKTHAKEVNRRDRMTR